MNVVETPTTYNVAITDASTEYSQALPSSTRKLRFQCRTAVDIRFAWVTGKVATPVAPYFTLKSGDVYIESDLDLTGQTLYLAAGSGSLVVEIEVFT